MLVLLGLLSRYAFQFQPIHNALFNIADVTEPKAVSAWLGWPVLDGVSNNSSSPWSNLPIVYRGLQYDLWFLAAALLAHAVLSRAAALARDMLPLE